jgi:hypothetical protein
MEALPVAEPTVAKVTLLAALAGVIGPLAAEYSFILAGALVGGMASLSMAELKLPGFWRPTRHVMTGTAMALLITPLGALVVSKAMPGDWAITADALLPWVAMLIGAFWHRAMARWIPGFLDKRLGAGGEK